MERVRGGGKLRKQRIKGNERGWRGGGGGGDRIGLGIDIKKL